MSSLLVDDCIWWILHHDKPGNDSLQSLKEKKKESIIIPRGFFGKVPGFQISCSWNGLGMKSHRFYGVLMLSHEEQSEEDWMQGIKHFRAWCYGKRINAEGNGM